MTASCLEESCVADNGKVSVQVLGGELFSGFYKEERTDGQTDGRFSHFPYANFSVPWSFPESTFEYGSGTSLKTLCFCVGASWSSCQERAAVRSLFFDLLRTLGLRSVVSSVSEFVCSWNQIVEVEIPVVCGVWRCGNIFPQNLKIGLIIWWPLSRASLVAQLAWRIRSQCGRPGFDSWVGKIPWRRRLPTPVFWVWEFHGPYSSWGRSQTRLSDFYFTSWYYTAAWEPLHFTLRRGSGVLGKTVESILFCQKCLITGLIPLD